MKPTIPSPTRRWNTAACSTPSARRSPASLSASCSPDRAALADRLAIVRSVHHEQASHVAEHIVETGYDIRPGSNTLKGHMPSMGMVYRHLGIDPAMTFDDYGGRPRYVLEEREPVVELL